jgi:hypothetical protein
MSVLVNQLRARAECIRATHFVHISEQDAREFAELFDEAAKVIERHEHADSLEGECFPLSGD